MDKGRIVAAFVDRHSKVLTSVFFVSVFCLSILLSSRFVGPVFLADELGYLNKAAVLAGYSIDVASSYYGGYSLLLAPIFFIFSEPETIWRAIVVLNALLVTVSLGLLLRVLERLFPKQPKHLLLAAVVLVALYPSWMTMVGHAFATPALIFFFMAALYASLLMDARRPRTVIAPALLFGYLCWVHPIGLAISLAWLVTLAFMWRFQARRSLLFAGGLVAAMILAYQIGLNPWLREAMNISTLLSSDHYAKTEAGLSAAMHPFFLLKCMVMAVGQLAAVIVTTFGLAVFVWQQAGRAARHYTQSSDSSHGWQVREVSLFLTVAMLSIIAFSCVTFSLAKLTIQPEDRFDFWIYGRYVEPVLMPVIGIGFLLIWRLKYVLWASAAVFATGLLFQLARLGDGAFFNNINVVSFWPRYVYQGEPNFLIWFTIAAIGVLYLTVIKRSQLLLFALPLFVLAMYGQAQVSERTHKQAELHPSGLIRILRSDFPRGTCVGYEGFVTQDRARAVKEDLYRFYLYDYDFRQMSYGAWLNSDCAAYLARDVKSVAGDERAVLLGHESDGEIYLVVKKEHVKRIKTSNAEAAEFYLNTALANRSCIIGGCFDFSAAELNEQGFVRDGKFRDGALRTNNKAGFLFYGPYQALKPGRYVLIVHAEVESKGATLEVIDGDTPEKAAYYTKKALEPTQGERIEMPFTLSSPASNLQVRLKVGANDNVTFYKYEIVSGRMPG